MINYFIQDDMVLSSCKIAVMKNRMKITKSIYCPAELMIVKVFHLFTGKVTALRSVIYLN